MPYGVINVDNNVLLVLLILMMMVVMMMTVMVLVGVGGGLCAVHVHRLYVPHAYQCVSLNKHINSHNSNTKKKQKKRRYFVLYASTIY